MDELNKNDAGCSGECGSCGSDCESLDPRNPNATVTLTLDDDTILECGVVAIYPVEEQEYIALVPLDENGEQASDEVYLYRFSETEAEGPSLSNIESDEEYDLAADAFDELLDEKEFEEIEAE
ncbi:MAG: DUF1292 domain-containing protein [Lachnospiraceae bacterium]|nr:DUF1292 domain-containing protein [Lachnospiraceae bacterium]